MLFIAGTISAVNAANPLGFREYTQKITMTFPSVAAAEKATLTPKPLPAGYELAYTCRWDDTNARHLNTHEVMEKNGIKGTFFLCNLYILKKDPDYLKKLLRGGCSIGLHTVHHYKLTSLDPYAQFREYMKNRIELETASQSPVNSQVYPFMNWLAPGPLITGSIGDAMMAVGVISSPDAIHPEFGVKLGYPQKSLAVAQLITPGDRNPDLQKMENQQAKILKDRKLLESRPAISMSMHSWHTPEGLRNLDRILATAADKANWWKCNLNEYGAYRYEALNTKVEKRIEGGKVVFTVSRVQPSELGANVPLWLDVTGAKPLTVSFGVLHEASLELPHSPEQRLPEIYGSTDASGRSKEISGVALRLTHPAEDKWLATFKNNGSDPITGLAFTFRFPSACENVTVRRDFSILAQGKNIEIPVSQKLKSDLFYRYGTPYYAVQCDFMQNGKLCRLYADYTGKPLSGQPLTVGDAAGYYQCPDKVDISRLSLPTTKPDALGLKPLESKRMPGIGCGIVYAGPPSGKKRCEYYLAVIDFKQLTSEPVVLKMTATSWRKKEFWLNGEKLNCEKGGLKLKLKNGLNRIVLKIPRYGFQFLLLNDERKQCVEFIRH